MPLGNICFLEFSEVETDNQTKTTDIYTLRGSDFQTKELVIERYCPHRLTTKSGNIEDSHYLATQLVDIILYGNDQSHMKFHDRINGMSDCTAAPLKPPDLGHSRNRIKI